MNNQQTWKKLHEQVASEFLAFNEHISNSSQILSTSDMTSVLKI